MDRPGLLGLESDQYACRDSGEETRVYWTCLSNPSGQGEPAQAKRQVWSQDSEYVWLRE